MFSIPYLLRNVLTAACAVAVLSPQAARAADIGALAQPAVLSTKSVQAAMLAIARAGARLVAVGERGVILLSDDDGKSWRQAPAPVRTSLTAVQFVDARNGWAVGHMGVVLHSADAGRSWRKQLDGVAIARIYQQAVRAGADSAQARDEQGYASMLSEDGPDKPLLALDFRDARHGLVVGAYNMALQTSDGGVTWEPFSQRLPNPRRLHLYKVMQRDQRVVLVGEQGLMLSSGNGGRDYSALASPYKGSWFGILAGRDGAWLAYGLRGSAWRSADQGATWSSLATGVNGSISAALAMADGRELLASQTGELLLTADGGQHFERVGTALAAPVAEVAQAADGALVAATLRGPVRIPLNSSVVKR